LFKFIYSPPWQACNSCATYFFKKREREREGEREKPAASKLSRIEPGDSQPAVLCRLRKFLSSFLQHIQLFSRRAQFPEGPFFNFYFLLENNNCIHLWSAMGCFNAYAQHGRIESS
jgi:hypothetical protein